MVGMAAMAARTAMFLLVDLETSRGGSGCIMFVRGMRMGFVFIPIQAAAFARIRSEATGRASALFQTQRQVGAAVGVAILATVLIERTTALLAGATSPAEAARPRGAFHDAVYGPSCSASSVSWPPASSTTRMRRRRCGLGCRCPKQRPDAEAPDENAVAAAAVLPVPSGVHPDGRAERQQVLGPDHVHRRQAHPDAPVGGRVVRDLVAPWTATPPRKYLGR